MELLLYLHAIFATFLAMSLNDSVSHEIDQYLDLISDIQSFYKTGSVYVVPGGTEENFGAVAVLLNLLRQLSSRKIFSQLMRLSDFVENYDTFRLKFRKNVAFDLVVFILHSEVDLKSLEDFTRSHSLSGHLWMILFWAKPASSLMRACEEPSNRFNLGIDVLVMVKCHGDPVIREWYTLSRGSDVITADLFEWTSANGLIKKYERDFYQRRNNFRGVELKVSTVKELEDVVNTKKNDTTEKVDVIQRIMTEIIEHMNFSIKFMPSMRTYGAYDKAKGKWNGMLGNVSDRDIDVPFTEITMTEQRFRDFDYTWPLFMTPSAMYIKHTQQPVVKWNAYFKIFEDRIWISITVLMAVASFAITVIKVKLRISEDGGFAHNCLLTWGIYCQQGLPEFPSPSPLRLGYVSLFFSTIVLLAVYSGLIVSNLANLTISLPFTSFDEFVRVKTHKLTVMKDSFDEDFFLYGTDEVLQKMKTMMVPREKLPSNNVEGFLQVCKEEVAFYTNVAMQQKVAHKIPCQISGFLTGRKRFMAVPLVKKNPLTRFINRQICRFKEFGLLNRIKSQYIRRNEYLMQKYYSVELSEITPLLTILALGVVVSLIVLSIECIDFSLRRNFQKSDDNINVEDNY